MVVPMLLLVITTPRLSAMMARVSFRTVVRMRPLATTILRLLATTVHVNLPRALDAQIPTRVILIP